QVRRKIGCRRKRGLPVEVDRDGQVVAVRAQEVHVDDVILLNEVLHSQGVGNRHRIVDVDRDLSGRGRLLVGKCGGAGPGRPATYRRRAGPEGIEPDSRGENRTIEQKAVDDPIGDTAASVAWSLLIVEPSCGTPPLATVFSPRLS